MTPPNPASAAPVPPPGPGPGPRVLPEWLGRRDACRYLHLVKAVFTDINRRLEAPPRPMQEGNTRSLLVLESVRYTVDADARWVAGYIAHKSVPFEPEIDNIEIGAPLDGPAWPYMLLIPWREAIAELCRAPGAPPNARADMVECLAGSVRRAEADNPRLHALRRAIGGWLALDPAVMAMAWKAAPGWPAPRLGAWTYSLVWRQQERFEQVARDAPHLLPLFCLAAGEYALPMKGEALAQLLQAARARRITRGGWRMLVNGGALAVTTPPPLFRMATRFEAALALAELAFACLPGRWLPQPFYDAMLALYVEDRTGAIPYAADWLSALPPRFLALAGREAARHEEAGTLPAFLDELREVGAWVREGARVHRHVAWSTLLERARTAGSLRRAAARAELLWPAPGGAVRAGGYTAVPLNTPRALVEEGLAMRHCAVTLVPLSRRDRTRLYSLRDASGRRVATMGLLPAAPAGWRLGQVAGFANGAVSAEVRAAAQAVVETLVGQAPT